MYNGSLSEKKEFDPITLDFSASRAIRDGIITQYFALNWNKRVFIYLVYFYRFLRG